MVKRNFITDLITSPGQVIDTIQKKWSLAKTVTIFVVTFFILSVSYFFVNFIGNVLSFFFTYGLIFGIIIESMALLLNLMFLATFLRFADWTGKTRQLIKTTSWLIMLPALIYYIITLPIYVLLRVSLQEGLGVYIYRTVKYIMYLWVIGLQMVAVTRDQKEIRTSNIAAVILAFTLTYVFIVIVNYGLVSLIQSRVEV